MEAVKHLYRYRRGITLGLAWLLMTAWIFFGAWVSEDAYITFRVIDNFFNGYGLRWNIHERVQVYTHPLWLLLHLPIYAAWDNLFQADMALSIFCSSAAIMVALLSVHKSLPVTLGCFFLPLIASRCFMDYTTSGLENPLSFLLLACFGYVLIKKYEHRYFWFLCALTTALALFNRLDTVILYAPVLLWLGVARRHDLRWRQIILGALPLLAWLSFSLFYYGFIFPNTKYAKLDTGLSPLIHIGQGIHYASFLLALDTASAMLMLVPLACIILRRRLQRFFPPFCFYIALGVMAYAAYVILIGGDYMMGRFWALPVFAAIWLLYIGTPSRLRPDVVFALVCLLGAAYAISIEMRDVRKACTGCIAATHVLDARRVFSANRLVGGLWPLAVRSEGHYPFANRGKKLAARQPLVKPISLIGMVGYYAGPHVVLVDMLGLADPLLARLPAIAKQEEHFYIGHFRRQIPEGYIFALQSGSTEKMDHKLALYYEKLKLITSGELLDKERLKTIIAFNLGWYDHWKEDYLRNR